MAFCYQKTCKKCPSVCGCIYHQPVILSGRSSGKATIQMQDNTRQAIGAGLLLEENEADRHRRIDELSGQLAHKEGSLGGYHQEKITINGVESWRTWTDNSFETLLVEDIEK